MEVRELKQVERGRKGYIRKNGVKLEPCEERAVKLLASYGFDIDVVRPTNIPGFKNPDILVSGAIWEVKSPVSCNKNTLKNRMKKASKQAGRIVF